MLAPAMYYFDDLGQRVEHLWRAEHYDDAAIPEIAERVFAANPPGAHITPTTIAQWILGRTTVPQQIALEGNFGQPALTAYRGRRFFVDLYYWLDGTTTIHQHGFAGAFHVLAGSSIHGQYTFRETRRLSSALLFGDLELTAMDVLPTGTTRRIVPYAGLIHSLFHIERPSLTIVIRNHGTTANPPSYIYKPPGLAVDPFHEDAYTTKACQLIATLWQAGEPQWLNIVTEFLERSDLHTDYRVLMTVFNARGSRPDAVDDLLPAVRRAHGEDAAGRLRAVFVAAARQEAMNRMRTTFLDPEPRFLIGVVRSAPSREVAERLVGQRWPGEPVADVLARIVPKLGDDEKLLAEVRALFGA
jgi:hypothetical protein